MSKEKPNRKEVDFVAAWDRFVENEKGAYPPRIAALYLRMTVQGVHSAADRGWIRYFMIGKERFYSRRDVVAYRWNVSKKFKDNRLLPSFVGSQNCTPRTPRSVALAKMSPEERAIEEARPPAY